MALAPTVSSQSIWKFSPQSIPGLMLWLDGADTNTMFTDTGGTTNATLGSTIQLWKDKSVNVYHATQATAGNAPTLNTNGLVFNVASATSLTSTYTANPTNETVFVVINPTTIIGGTFDIVSTTVAGGREIYISTGSQVGTAAAGSPAACLGPAITATTKLIEMTYATTAASILEYYNGTVQVDTGTDTTAFSGAGITRIGGGPTSNYFAGTIYEVICYNTVLTAVQRQQVEGYLSWKWNLQTSLPLTHPYKSSLGIMPFSRSFLPVDISGCILWLDAADLSTITGNPVVTQWNDKSGNAYNAATKVGTVTYNPSASSPINSIPTITFSAASYLTTTANVYTTTFRNVFAVVNVGANPGGASINYPILTTPTPAIGATVYSSNGDLELNRTGGQLIASSTSGFLSSSSVVSLTNSTGNVGIFVNGNSQTITTNNITTFTAGSAVQYIGYSASTQPITIGEIIVYDALLTTQQRQHVEGYLSNKWKLTTPLPATAPIHPFKYYYPSTPTPFNPLVIGGPAIWLDAADASSVTLNSGNVSQWSDKSGNNAHMTQATTSKMPLYVTNASTSNNQNIIRFDGLAAQTLANAAVSLIPSAGSPATFILVERNMTSNATYTNPGPFGFSAGPNGGLVYQQNAALQPFFTVGFTSATTRMDIYYRKNTNGAGADTGFVNGTSVAATDGSVGTYSSSFAVGVRRPNEQYVTGDICELIIFTFQLTTNQRQQIEGYLSKKWGITLPTTHPYYKISP